MLPRVIIHNGVSADGRMDHFTGDVGLYYELAARLGAEAMLSGSGTVLAAFAGGEMPAEAETGPFQRNPDDTRGWLVIVDSRGQIGNLAQIRRQPYWRDVIVLCSRATPPAHREYLHREEVEILVTGDDRVDLRAALAELREKYGIKTLRIDSGGLLNGALLRAGLVDEVSLLVTPALVGGTTPRSFFVAPDLASPEGVIPLKLAHFEKFDDGTLWLRYEVAR